MRLSRPSRPKGRARGRKRTKLAPLRAVKKHNQARIPSSLELTVYRMLEDEGIPFVREKAIGRLHVDIFLAPKTVVECAGCFWHGCLSCNGNPSEMQKIAIVKDARRSYVLRKKGYDVVTIWEHEVKAHPDRVRAMLRGIWDGIVTAV